MYLVKELYKELYKRTKSVQCFGQRRPTHIAYILQGLNMIILW